MVSDFPRTLSVLRAEKKISQRTAAQELGISQALLSHYENGVREPGLAFLVRAADYYGVSCDYMLGRTLNRSLNSVDADSMADGSLEKGNVLHGGAFAMLQKKLIVNSSALIMDILSKSGSRRFAASAAGYLSASVYKVWRYIYMAGEGDGGDAVFPMPSEYFSEACDAELKHCEIEMKSCVLDMAPDGGKAEPEKLPPLSHNALAEEYPSWSQSLFTLLHSVGERLKKRVL